MRECAQGSDSLTPWLCVWQEELSRFSQHHSGWQLSLQPFLLRCHHIWIEESASQKTSQLFELLLDGPRCLFAWSDCVSIHSQGRARPHKLTPGLCIAERTGHWREQDTGDRHKCFLQMERRNQGTLCVSSASSPAPQHDLWNRAGRPELAHGVAKEPLLQKCFPPLLL